MLSVWDTKKFRVHAHPCDRDYQHIQGMQGCAPSFSLATDKRGLLGYVSTSSGKRLEVDAAESKSTYAQTIDRQRFGIVGLGRPNFDISMQSPYRGTGFMSETTIFKNDKTVFKSCRY